MPGAAPGAIPRPGRAGTGGLRLAGAVTLQAVSGFRHGIDLYWLPLGAGGHVVRVNGLVYEAIAAWHDHRPRRDLYHSALAVRTAEGRWIIESAPIRVADGPDRGVVAEGPVGSRRLDRWKVFRYELRFWRDGVLPDAAEAVDSPRHLTDDAEAAGRLIALGRTVPTPVWGRDELRTGEMWNSNSLVSWLIVRSGLDVDAVRPPAGGRAPGWEAGIVVARRQQAAKSCEPTLPLAATQGAPDA